MTCFKNSFIKKFIILVFLHKTNIFFLSSLHKDTYGQVNGDSLIKKKKGKNTIVLLI